jgi:hypothetical protein
LIIILSINYNNYYCISYCSEYDSFIKYLQSVGKLPLNIENKKLNYKIDFNSIGFYRLKNKSDVKFVNISHIMLQEYFQFMKHPLIYLNLNIIYDNISYGFDLIVNTTLFNYISKFI